MPTKNLEWDWTGYPAIRNWREQNHVFEDVAAVARPDMLSVLGAAPMLGRTFWQAEAQRGGNVVILGYRFWQRHFGGSRAALGRSLQADHQSCTVIGVKNPSFEFPTKETQLWLLISAAARWPKFQQFRFADAFTSIARLKSGVSLTQARAEMNAITRRLALEYPATDVGLGVRVVPLAEQMAGPQVRRGLWVLLGAVLCVLLARAENRSAEELAAEVLTQSVRRRQAAQEAQSLSKWGQDHAAPLKTYAAAGRAPTNAR